MTPRISPGSTVDVGERGDVAELLVQLAEFKLRSLVGHE